ncbi:GNAT family N-acetyltransferase [Staphylococcus chromogenes]|uniref:GNAT family N-acetyltransferase n=1 Tax=Staphylococcus chromogenes TaxID=46126 RepID=UPI0021D3D1C7|nr:N-acetyltransferase [Staphylococcus chromogenes]UXS68255.1 GNAT family N-acetyltransferase [Staphylococcus chromogenes]
MTTVDIHPAYPELPESGFLTTLAIEEMSYPLFGTGRLNEIYAHIHTLWKKKHNRFSYDFSWIAHVDGQVAGIITAMPAKQIVKADVYTFWHILQLKQWNVFKHLYEYANNIQSLLALEEGKEDEFHITLLAVMPEFHRQGIASELLQHIDVFAHHHGYRKVSLTVKQDNIEAQQLYKKQGFTIDQALHHDPYHLYRMVKQL